MEGKISPFQELNQNNWPTMKVMTCECVWQFIFNKQLTIMQIVLSWKKHNYGSRRLNVQMTFKWFVTSYLMLKSYIVKRKKIHPHFFFSNGHSQRNHMRFIALYGKTAPITLSAHLHGLHELIFFVFNQDVCLWYTSPGQSPNK